MLTRRSALCLAAALVLTASLACIPRAQQSQQILIGAILPLTGPIAYLGEEERNVLQLAQDEVNGRSDGPKVQVLIEDSAASARDGVSAYQKLRQQVVQNMIVALTLVALPVNPLAEKDNVLQFALSVDPTITSRTKNLIRAYYGLEDEMSMMAEHLAKQGARRVAALYVNTPEGDAGFNQSFKGSLASKNIEYIGAETYELTDKSVRNQLLKLREMNPDYIMTMDFGFMYPTILAEAEALGMREKILGGLGMMTAPPMPAELTRGLTFTSAAFAIEPTPRFTEFANRYQQKYGKPVTFDGVYTYDAFYILYDNLRAGKTSFADFVNKTYDGVSGTIAVDGTGRGTVAIDIARYDASGKASKVR